MCECGGPSRENLQPGGAAPSPCPPPPLVQTSAEGRRGPPWLHGPKEEGLGGLRASVWSWLVCRCASVVPLRPHSPPVFTILGSHLIPKVWARAELSQSPLGDANVPAARKPERGCGGQGVFLHTREGSLWMPHGCLRSPILRMFLPRAALVRLL